MDSILTSIKKLLGPSGEYEAFDPDIIMHINTVFMDLRRIGVGPVRGFRIEDDTTTWTDFIPDADLLRLEAIKDYVYLNVKLLFDPPTNGSHMESINKRIEKLEWTINMAAESEV